MMAPLPTFADFYRAIHGRDPFSWQARLARRVAETNEWPEEVGVPTGLGKTACLDIAVWWLASQADQTPSLRTAPTRIWWVVNRRLLVDSTHDQAERLACILAEPDASELSGHNREVVATVAQRLRSLSADPAAPPLDVIRLRGGVASRTPADPSQLRDVSEVSLRVAGVQPRPSLSERAREQLRDVSEVWCRRGSTPAFVERTEDAADPSEGPPVSPGFNPGLR